MSENVVTDPALAARIAALGKWFHNLNLNGVSTAPKHFLGDFPRIKWAHFADSLPHDLRGKSVLDIGCNAGFYCLEMKRRHADRVLGIDSDPRYLAQAKLAAEIEGAEIEFRQMSVYDVRELKEQFDLVLFMGVFYHLRHPLLALDLIHKYVVRDLLVFQSLIRGSRESFRSADDYPFEDETPFEDPAYPSLHFVEKSYAGDPTNWWIPNRACVEGMLRDSGFEILGRPEEETYLCKRRKENAP